MSMTFLPLHPAQRDVYTDQLINADSPHYNIGGYIRLKGSLDSGKFHETIHSIPAVFDSFKLRFSKDSVEPQCFLNKEYKELILSEMDLSSLDNPRAEALLWMQGRFNTPFGLTGDNLLFENYLIKISAEEHWFFGRFHHLITDGYGFIVYVKYLAQKYRSLVAGDNVHFSSPSYTEEASTAAEYFTSSEYQADAQYWKQRITEKPAKTLLPKHSLQHKTSNTSSTYKLDIDPATAELLSQLQLDTKAGLQQLTIAALIVYFGKATNQSNFILGVTVHKRNHKRLRQIVGMFSGILPFKGYYQKDKKVLELVKEITLSQRADYRHQNFPIGEIARQLKTITGDGYLHEISVIHESLNFELDFGDGLKASIERLESDHEPNPLQISWREYGDNLPMRLHVNFRIEYFSLPEVKLLVDSLLFVLSQFSTKPGSQLADIDILPMKERALLAGFNNTSTDFPAHKNLVTLIDEQAAKNPNATAVVFEGKQLSYNELNERSNQLANYLRKKGVKEQALVPICLERSFEMIIGILGILKSGAAYVPIDPAYPAERIAYMLEDTSASLILTGKESRMNLKVNESIDVVELDGDDVVAIQKESTAGLRIDISPRHLAYMIYTSGSTGKPKGAMNEHRGVVNRLCWAKDYFEVTPQDSILQKTTFSFDVSVWELLLPLISGARLVLAKPGGHTDSIYLKEIVEKEKITVIHFVPSMLAAFLPDLGEGDCAGLKSVVCSGEALKPAQVSLLKQKLPVAGLHNLYGPTEAAIDVTYWRMPSTEAAFGLVPIGKPIANTSIYILNENGLVPFGNTGEIYIGGVQVGRGYLNRSELTAEKFVPDPFSTVAGATMYKTGDLGRWLEDGNIEYLGRIDEQVKIRGYRIELGEIENVLQQSKLVQQCVVIAKEDHNGNKRLIGYVVEKGVFDKQAVIAFLHAQLPEYMVPGLWIQLDELPLTPNGKVDKKALPEPDTVELSINEYIPPRNEVELIFAGIWQGVLGVSSVGINDNFFELGGDSIMTIQVASRARRSGYTLQPKDLFLYPTIAKLSAAISNLRKDASNNEQGILTGQSGLLPIQQWYFENNTDALSHFNQSVLLGINKSVTDFPLEKAFQQLTRQHDALRFRYSKLDGKWVQEYGEMETSIITDDLSSASGEQLPALIAERANHHHSNLHLQKDSLVRVVWMHTPAAETQHRLLIIVHHLAVDGVSWRILLEDLESLLHSTNDKIGLSDKTASYRQWYKALENYGQTKGLLAQTSYWQG
ncbi:MAG: amino acid adenylation domain-containing protein, partial [Ferruginibacter sp.]